MKHSLKLFTLICCIALTSCMGAFDNDKEEVLDFEKDFEWVRVNNEYEIKLPDYMNETDYLNEDASLQYQNIFKETYIVVIDEPADDFEMTFRDIDMYDESLTLLQNYRDIQMQYFEEELEDYRKIDQHTISINGMDAEVVEADGSIDGVGIAYTNVYVHGRNKIYMILAWTLKERRNKFKNTFDKAIKSFRLSKSR